MTKWTTDVILLITRASSESAVVVTDAKQERELVSSTVMLSKISRDVQAVSDENPNNRREALKRMQKNLFKDFEMS